MCDGNLFQTCMGSHDGFQFASEIFGTDERFVGQLLRPDFYRVIHADDANLLIYVCKF